MRNGKYKKKLGSKVCTEKPAKEPAAAAEHFKNRHQKWSAKIGQK